MKSFIDFIVAGIIKILSLTEMVSDSSSVHLRLSLDRFSWHLIVENFMTICLEISNLVNMG